MQERCLSTSRSIGSIECSGLGCRAKFQKVTNESFIIISDLSFLVFMKIATLLSAVVLFYGLVPALAVATGIPRAAVVKPTQIAKSAAEINKLARAITVKIGNGRFQGSGILLQQQGDVYTVLTAAHVVKGSLYNVITPDDQNHRVFGSSIRRYAGDVDLAVLTFRSNRRYTVAQLGNSNTLAGGVDIYVAGFPTPTQTITQSVFAFREGKVTANSKKVFEKGYSLVYSNETLPGMSGGPVLDSEGKVVGVHGRGDRDENSGVKTGYNLAIPIARFADIAQSLGVTVSAGVARTTVGSSLTADDYLVAGEQKQRNGDNSGALADYNKAILLDPNYAEAYLLRGKLKEQEFRDNKGAMVDLDRYVALSDTNEDAYLERGLLRRLNDPQGALADFNKAITLNPNYVRAYSLRSYLKSEKLNDRRGALADYDRIVALSNTADAYITRGIFKAEVLKDPQGALADINKAIALDPNSSGAYSVRSNLKLDKLNDPQGALADLDRIVAASDSPEIYGERARFKVEKLNDLRGALADYDRYVALSDTSRNTSSSIAQAYLERGYFKAEKLHDYRGALADYNRYVSFSKAADAHYLRGLLKYEKLKDHRGALADFSAVISINPSYIEAYHYRGILKYEQLKDRSGGIADVRQSARLARAQNRATELDDNLQKLREWGVSE
jgi:tetratricopeptide (TPR) repeat protein